MAENIYVMGILVNERAQRGPQVQEVLSRYGSVILSRNGIPDPSRTRGIITLTLESDAAAEEAFAEVRRLVDELPSRLASADAPVDVQTVVEAFAVLEGPTRVGARCRIATGAVVGGPPQDVHYQGEPTQLLIGEQVYLGPYTTVSRGTPKGGGVTRIGQGCVLEYGAHVGHDCQLGREVRMEPLSALAGHVVVGDGAEIGALAGVHHRLAD